MNVDRKRKLKKGLTLVEVMIGLGVLSLNVIGLSTAMIQAQRMSYQAIYQNAAFHAAQGFLEQIRSMPYTDFEAAYADPDNVTLPTLSTSALSSDVIFDDPLTFQASLGSGSLVRNPNAYDEKQVVIDIREDENEIGETVYTEIIMPIRFTLDLVNLSEGPGGQTPLDAFEVSLVFQYEVPSASGPYWKTGKLVTVVGKHEI